jgi:3-oxoacyl-[acyl-carrier protein] reductase
MSDLKSKIAVITGSAQGIGAGCARVLANHGADIVMVDISRKDKARETITKVEACGSRLKYIQADVTDLAQVQGFVKEVVDQWGRIDILVNNVGTHSIPPYAIESLDLDSWHRYLDINLTSMFLCIKAVLPVMKQQKWGRIINMSSLISHRGSYSGDIAYTAGKAGVNGITLSLFRSIAPFGITINSIAPGLIDTDMLHTFIQTKEAMQENINRVPMGRLGKPEEVGELVAYLSSDKAAYITGQWISINGGEYA